MSKQPRFIHTTRLVILAIGMLCAFSRGTPAYASTPYKFSLTIVDTHGQPVTAETIKKFQRNGEIQIKFQDVFKQPTEVLKDVEPLKPSGGPGGFETILQLDKDGNPSDDDSKKVWRATINAPGFLVYV